jgi:hypothetical protein
LERERDRARGLKRVGEREIGCENERERVALLVGESE